MSQPLAECDLDFTNIFHSQNHKVVTQVQLANAGKFSNV